MWNLICDFEHSREAWKELLELEFFYAGRMARIEKRPLAETLAAYTEWYEFGCDVVPDAASRFTWLSRIEDDAERARVFETEIAPRLKKRFSSVRHTIFHSHAGFMSEAHSEYYSDSPELLLTLHFRNRFAPDSPFAHQAELAAGLREIVTEFSAVHPEIERVQCASWLNNRPEFLALFPDEWKNSRTLCLPMEGSAGWWGSFIDRRGNFNRKCAERFKRLGGFSMPNIHCRCRMTALKEHLEKISFRESGDGKMEDRQKGMRS